MLGVACLTATAQIENATPKTNTFQTIFCKRGVLTVDEIAILVKMAASKGITQIDKIETSLIHPSSYVQIMIKEQDIIDGDNIHYKNLLVFKKGWVPETFKPANGMIVIGDFWEDSTYEQDLTLFTIEGKTLRVTIRGEIEKDVATAILTVLVQRNWEAQHSSLKDERKKIPSGVLPCRLSREKKENTFSATFTKGQEDWEIVFTFIKGKIVVSRFCHLIS